MDYVFFIYGGISMSKKHFIIKGIVVSLMVCSTTLSAFATESENYDLTPDNPNITIHFEEEDITTESSVSVLGVDGLKHSLDETFGVIRRGNIISGLPFSDGLTLYSGLKNSSFVEQYKANKDEVIKSVRLAYPNETNQWYDEYIALPIYYNVLSGYEDGSLQPNRPVTVSEVAKIVATAYEGAIQSGGYLANNAFNSGSGMWYNNYYNKIAKAFTYKSSRDITPQYMEQNMRRCEVAYVLASVCDDGTLKDYIARASNGDISQMAGYTDFVNVVKAEVSLSTEQAYMNAGQIPSRFAGAVMYLQAKGIMIGDGEGHINPLDNVTRAEVFKLIQTTCENTPSYTKNKFYGWEVKPSSGSSTQTPVQNQMTEETVLNPNAPAELQYKVKDLWESSYKYILNGQANIAEKTLKKEYAERVARSVISTIKVNGDKITLELPDIKSDYHEISVINIVYGPGDTDVFLSSKQSGTITIDKKSGACIEVRVVGKQGAAVRPAGSSIIVSYDVDTGEVTTY